MADDDTRSDLRWHRPWLTGIVVAGVAGAFVAAVTGLPRAGAALPEVARHAMKIALPQWGTTEGVSEIVYGSRGWDTFGETFLLLAAVVATTVLARSREPRSEYVGEATAGRAEQEQADPGDGVDAAESKAREAEKQEGELAPAPDDADDDPLGTPAPERAAGMTVIVRVVTRVAAPILAVASVYLAAWGYTPGGGFPAGAALTGVVILVYAAFGHRIVGRIVRPSVLEPIEMAGAGALVVLGVVGIALKGSFLDNWLPLAEQQTIRAGGTLQIFSAAELIEVATGLIIAIFMLLGMQHEWSPDEDDRPDDEDEDES
jgi:multicomponent Na+:H+ antiporter subunit B